MARPRAFSKGSSWCAFSASRRIRLRSRSSITTRQERTLDKSRSVPVSAGILTDLQEVPEDVSSSIRRSSTPSMAQTSSFSKFRKMSAPYWVCSTSGWNWRPNIGSPWRRIAWIGQFGELARAMNPDGRRVTSSLCDSHTSNRAGRPWNKTSGSWTLTIDFPNSGTLAGAASPPKCFAMNWCPAQIPRIGPSNLSRYSPFRPIFPGSTPTFGAPPESTRPSSPRRSGTGVSFATMFVSTPRYFRTRHSRWVHCPPLSTTETRMGYRNDPARKRFLLPGPLFPFDCGWRLVRDVVHDSIDGLHLVRDSRRDSVRDVLQDFLVRP